MGSITAISALGSYIGDVSRDVFNAGRNVSRRMVRVVCEPETIRNGGIALVAKHPAISPEMRKVLYFDNYEIPELEILRRTLSPEDRVLEIGGGIGFLSAYTAQVCGDDNVIMVEANPTLETLIRRNHAMNGVAPRVIMAVATCDGTRQTETLFLADNFWSTSTVRQQANKVVVPTVNLNRLIEDFMPSYLILDIEGAEVEMIPALRLDGVKKLLVELHPHVTGNGAADGVVRRLVEAGFLADFEKSKLNQVYLTR